MADRDTTHDLPVDFGDQKRRGHPTPWNVTSTAHPVEAADIGRPRLAAPQVQQEVESLSRELCMSGPGIGLVAKA